MTRSSRRRGLLVVPQARAAQRKTRWSTPPRRPSAGPHAQPYRRRPETTILHRIVREHLETYLALVNDESDPVGPMGDGIPDHVEKEFRSYLKCGILAHGFARARCATCGYDFLVALACYAYCAPPARAAISAGSRVSSRASGSSYMNWLSSLIGW